MTRPYGFAAVAVKAARSSRTILSTALILKFTKTGTAVPK
jgi:hypothetical protein